MTSANASTTATSTTPGTVKIMVMKHLCTNIDSEAAFLAMSFAQKEAACPTVVMQGDQPTPGTISGGTNNFQFEVSAISFGDDTGKFIQEKVCETQLGIDANKDGTIASSTCLDASHYDFPNVPTNTIKVLELKNPDDSYIADVIATKPDLSLITVVDGVNQNTIALDTDSNTEVMLHVFEIRLSTPNQPINGSSTGDSRDEMNTSDIHQSMDGMDNAQQNNDINGGSNHSHADMDDTSSQHAHFDPFGRGIYEQYQTYMRMNHTHGNSTKVIHEEGASVQQQDENENSDVDTGERDSSHDCSEGNSPDDSGSHHAHHTDDEE
jgi:hypothetical protein